MPRLVKSFAANAFAQTGCGNPFPKKVCFALSHRTTHPASSPVLRSSDLGLPTSDLGPHPSIHPSIHIFHPSCLPCTTTPPLHYSITPIPGYPASCIPAFTFFRPSRLGGDADGRRSAPPPHFSAFHSFIVSLSLFQSPAFEVLEVIKVLGPSGTCLVSHQVRESDIM